MRKEIIKAAEESIRAIETIKSPEALEFVEKASLWIADCFSKGGKLLIAGNGGSLCDAIHFAEELTGFFREKRKALPAIALSDPGHMSCTANDVGYEQVFSRAIEAYGKSKDLFIALSTSGNSENLFQALLQAKAMGLRTLSFLGKSGGKMKRISDLEWIVSGFSTSDRIQEAHMTVIHILIEMVEKRMKLTPSIESNGSTLLKSLKEKKTLAPF